MKKFLALFLDAPTIVSVLGIATIIAGIPLSLFMMTVGGGGGLGGFIILGWLLVLSVILFFDRLLVKIVKPAIISVVELVFVCLTVLYYSYQNREIVIDISNNESGYFIVFFSEEGMTQQEMRRGFLFDRKVTPPGNAVFISPTVKERYEIDFDLPSVWLKQGAGSQGGISGNGVKYELLRIIPLTDAQKDSIITQEINSAANN